MMLMLSKEKWMLTLSKEKWTLVGHRQGIEVYACLNSQGAACWYINHGGRSEADVNDGAAVAPRDAFPSDGPLCFRPLAWSPVPDEPEAPAEQPKADPYEAHRQLQAELGRYESDMGMWTSAKQGRDATARLLRGLEGEKVRERVRAFPHPARNPR